MWIIILACCNILLIITSPIGLDGGLLLFSDGVSVFRLQLGVLCSFTGLAVSFLSLDGVVGPLLEDAGLTGTRGLLSPVPALLDSFLTLKDWDLPRVAVGPDGSGLLDLLKEDLR